MFKLNKYMNESYIIKPEQQQKHVVDVNVTFINTHSLH